MNNSTSYDFTQLDPAAYTDDNCNDIMQVWSYLQYNATQDTKDWANFDSEESVYQYIVQGLHISASDHEPPLEVPPMNQDFWNWAVNDKLLLDNVDTVAWVTCPEQLCKAVGWEGSPDIAGVGMLATYIIQAVLITVYLFGILMVNINQQYRPQMWTPLRRILCAVLDSTREFLTASAIFSLALLIASVSSIAQSNATETSTTWILELVIPLYSVLAVVILHLAAYSILIRYKGRVSALLILDIMVIVLAVRSSVLFNELDWKDNDPSLFESPCLKVESFNSMAIFFWAVAGILCLGLTAYLVDFLVSMARRRPGLFGQLSDMIRWGIIVAGLCIMWYLIGWFVKLTLDIRSRAGDNNKDNEWTFGQVLALSTWAPFIIEFGYNIWEGPKKANEARANYPSKSALQGPSPIELSEEDEERGNFEMLK
ncbi:unnamed protein product [Alternaria burnsii]|nr:unnamed protein product [Alternaria burnsii]